MGTLVVKGLSKFKQIKKLFLDIAVILYSHSVVAAYFRGIKNLWSCGRFSKPLLKIYANLCGLV